MSIWSTGALSHRELDLGGIVLEVGELYGPIGEEKQIRFDIQAAGAWPAPGDKDLLIEAIANHLDNLIKFSPSDGEVCLYLENRNEGAVIRVSDTGAGVPSKERASVMRRFYQIDRSRHVPGSGLSLSIVLAIAKLHDFEVVISDAHPGCRFELLCYNAAAQSKAAARRVASATRPKPAFPPPRRHAGPADDRRMTLSSGRLRAGSLAKVLFARGIEHREPRSSICHRLDGVAGCIGYPSVSY